MKLISKALNKMRGGVGERFYFIVFSFLSYRGLYRRVENDR